MVVVAVIAIVVVVTIPSMLHGRISANETSTISFFKQAVIANEQYRTRFGSFALTFDDLVNSGHFADAQNPSGYSLSYLPAVETWAILGSPQEPGETGDRHFYVDQTGVIRSAVDGPASSTSAPIDVPAG